MEAEIFLNSPVNALGLSGQFRDQCTGMGFKTIGEITRTSPEVLIKMDGFNYHWLAELSEVLNKEGLLHLLQPITGSNHG